MQSKRLVHFYDEHCSRTISKIAVCEKTLSELDIQLQDMHDQSVDMQQQLVQLWKNILGTSLQQQDIYLLKRKEALILARYDERQFQMQEIRISMADIKEKREGLQRLRLHYEKKKNKWEWMSGCEKKMRIRKDIHHDEQAAEECVTWLIQ